MMVMEDTLKDTSIPSSTTHIPQEQEQEQEQELILVKFDEGDPRNPIHFSYARKWAITLTCCVFSGTTGAAASSYSISYDSMIQDLHCTELQASLGLGLYAMGYGVVPLICSSFSEDYGRRPVYIVSSILFCLAEMMNALAPNIQVVIVSRALQGSFGASGVSLVGGIIADIWEPHERGFPMSLFALATIMSFGLGSVFGGLIAGSPHLGWRWVQWVHVIFAAAYVPNVLLVLSETRSSIILAGIAKDKRKATGDPRYRSSSEIDKPSLLSMIKTTCTRPLYLLLTEPIVQSFSLWSGLTWGVMYCLLESVPTEFRSVYKFNVTQTGLAFLIGAFLGFVANRYQEVLYRKYFPKRRQEARLCIACVAAIILPVSMFLYAWTTSPHIHWIVPVIGLTGFMSGVLVIFQVAFLYLADCYGPYASSAQAGQTLARNATALTLPLVSTRMIAIIGFRWVLTIWAVLAVLLAPVPWVLYFFGPKIRSRSKISRKILEVELQRENNGASSSAEASVVKAS